MIFVKIAQSGKDRFYILTWECFRDLLVGHHKAFLARNDGMRPKRRDSLHCAISEQSLIPYQDTWEIIENSLQ